MPYTAPDTTASVLRYEHLNGGCPVLVARTRSQRTNDEGLDPGATTMPFRDGWRTPAIEDPEHQANRSRRVDYGFANEHTPRQRSGPSDDDEVLTKAEDHDEERPKHLSWPQRMQHVTWAYFTITMATGGIANVLHEGSKPSLHPVRTHRRRTTDYLSIQYPTVSKASTPSASYLCFSTSCSTSSYGQ